MINSLGSACTCIPGFDLNGDHCTSSSVAKANCTAPNTVLSGSQCICVQGTVNISGVCGSCPLAQTFNRTQCVIIPFFCNDSNSSPNSDQTQCLCNIGFSRTNSTGLCLSTCQTGSSFDSFELRCICNQGLNNISGICTVCGPNQTYDSFNLICNCSNINQIVNSSGLCQCAPNTHNISGSCQSCPNGTIYQGGICIAIIPVVPVTPIIPTAPVNITVIPNCTANQILQGNICVCDSFSIKVGASCIRCSPGLYPNIAIQQCQACILGCLTCSNQQTCITCISGYTLQSDSLACNLPVAQSNYVLLRNNFPIYTPVGIATDFVINKTINSFKTEADLNS